MHPERRHRGPLQQQRKLPFLAPRRGVAVFERVNLGGLAHRAGIPALFAARCALHLMRLLAGRGERRLLQRAPPLSRARLFLPRPPRFPLIPGRRGSQLKAHRCSRSRLIGANGLIAAGCVPGSAAARWRASLARCPRPSPLGPQSPLSQSTLFAATLANLACMAGNCFAMAFGARRANISPPVPPPIDPR